MADCCELKNVMLLACSGGSNVGQLSNDCAKRLTQLGQGKMFCAVGVAGKLDMPNGSTFVDAAKAADVRVAIDGCGVRCVGKALESSGLTVDVQVVLSSEMPMEKGYNFDTTEADVAKACGITVDKIKAL